MLVREKNRRGEEGFVGTESKLSLANSQIGFLSSTECVVYCSVLESVAHDELIRPCVNFVFVCVVMWCLSVTKLVCHEPSCFKPLAFIPSLTALDSRPLVMGVPVTEQGLVSPSGSES